MHRPYTLYLNISNKCSGCPDLGKHTIDLHLMWRIFGLCFTLMLTHTSHTLTLPIFTRFNSYHKICSYTCSLHLFSILQFTTVHTLAGSTSYHTSSRSIVSDLSLRKRWILCYIGVRPDLHWFVTPSRISWRRAETVQRISEASTVSAKRIKY